MARSMIRSGAAVLLVAATGLLAGCVYDPYTGSYYPCCSYPSYGYGPVYPPAYGYPAYPYPPSGEAMPGYGYPAEPDARSSQSDALVRWFDAANVTQDGRLTRQQAEASNWPNVAQNFATIDIGQKGYVTLDDLRVWLAAHPPSPPSPPGARG